MTQLNKVVGCLVGLACGDAVGTTVEFKRRGHFEPVTDMVGGGPFNLDRGQWTDDTSMALCLAQSLLYRRGFDAKDQMTRYVNWHQHGYMSSTGTCFDIGNTVRTALANFQLTGDPMSGSVDPMSAGNGALMRLAAVPMFYLSSPENAIAFAEDSTKTTHGAAECIDSSRYFCSVLMRAMLTNDKDSILATNYQAYMSNVKKLTSGEYLTKAYSELTGSGYVIESLESALWCFYHGKSFRESILLATNIGNDADTTAAICGQVCGAFYGINGIPKNWATEISMSAEIHDMGRRLFELGCELNGTPPALNTPMHKLVQMAY